MVIEYNSYPKGLNVNLNKSNSKRNAPWNLKMQSQSCEHFDLSHMLNNIAASAYTNKPDIYLKRVAADEQIATQTFGDARSDGT